MIKGNENFEGLIRDLTIREKLQDKVKMIGVVRGEDRLYLMKHVHFSMKTSCHEVFTVAYLEAIG